MSEQNQTWIEASPILNLPALGVWEVSAKIVSSTFMVDPRGVDRKDGSYPS
jgi:hypothetical protein